MGTGEFTAGGNPAGLVVTVFTFGNLQRILKLTANLSLGCARFFFYVRLKTASIF